MIVQQQCLARCQNTELFIAKSVDLRFCTFRELLALNIPAALKNGTIVQPKVLKNPPNLSCEHCCSSALMIGRRNVPKTQNTTDGKILPRINSRIPQTHTVKPPMMIIAALSIS